MKKHHYISKLDNQLRIITAPMPSLESATVMFWVGAGSRHEDKKLSGISHFLEHMAFKGGQKYRSAKQVAETIDAIGGEFNASTSKHWTNYYVKAQVDKLEVAFDVLSDMLTNPLLKEEEIEKEKGVITEEIGVYEDRPARKVWDYLDNLIFGKNPLAMDIIGTRKTVKNMSRDDFVQYRNIYYHTDNILLTVAGGVTQKEVLNLARKYFSQIKQSSPAPQAKKVKVFNKNRFLLKQKDTQQTNFALGFPGIKLGHKSRYTESILEAILGSGMSSRLFTEVREKRGLAYSVFASSDNFTDTGTFTFYAGTDPNKAEEAIKVILNQLHQIASKEHKIDSNELNKAKGYLKGHFALGLEGSSSVDYFLGNEAILLGKTRTPEEVFSGIDSVTVSEVNTLAKEIFTIEKAYLAIIGPYKSDARFRKLIS